MKIASAMLVALAAACTAPPPPSAPVAVTTPSRSDSRAPLDEPLEPSIAEPPAPLEPPTRIAHTVEDIALTIELPSPAWKPHPGIGSPPDGVTHVGFERDDVHDDQGQAVRPYCGITSELVPPEGRDIVLYSLSWRLRIPFSVDSVHSHEDGFIGLKRAIAYQGRTSYGGNEHTVFVVHGLFRDRGYVVVCDTTTSVLPQVRAEMEAVLQSLHHSEAQAVP